ncbi:uncharacterized protein LOC142861868 [Microcebus murinus]|uniref:uncharacterized protein LOC142861868 n=1 Tax=Microcebus murinus TaxID=30608 RepID=UPI003F6B06A8
MNDCHLMVSGIERGICWKNISGIVKTRKWETTLSGVPSACGSKEWKSLSQALLQTTVFPPPSTCQDLLSLPSRKARPEQNKIRKNMLFPNASEQVDNTLQTANCQINRETSWRTRKSMGFRRISPFPATGITKALSPFMPGQYSKVEVKPELPTTPGEQSLWRWRPGEHVWDRPGTGGAECLCQQHKSPSMLLQPEPAVNPTNS